MADIDDSGAGVCPVIKMIQEPKTQKQVYRVTWFVHNHDAATNKYSTARKEKYFETIGAANRFNEKRKIAADLLGILEERNVGHPMVLEVEDDES